MSISNITPQQLSEICKNNENVDLIDVRTAMEYAEVHAVPARNIPLDKLDPATLFASCKGSAKDPLYVICHSGSRSRQACEKLIKAGCTNAVNVEGGTQAWTSAGLPVVRGKKAFSLARQVRITAGSLVCLGAILSWFVHPGYIAISAFVGAGLVFSGVTDTCAMGLLLARMPWNRGDDSSCRCSAG
jgi:rhodanese-related sulfurtransferase